jgi:2-polyprenyl-6-methoxyphenol hydroxylase-like FAD-dependent oxidoreductase
MKINRTLDVPTSQYSRHFDAFHTVMGPTRKCTVAVVGSGPVGLLLSNILSHYGVGHVLIDRRMNAVQHPQAHFLTARSMEILQSHCPSSYKEMLHLLQASVDWREFSYCHTLSGTQLSRVDHFMSTPAWFWNETPTNVAHLAQSKVETALRKEVMHNLSQGSHFLAGHRVVGCRFSKAGSVIVVEGCQPNITTDKFEVECEYLVGADGSSSFVREALGITMEGEEAMQHLVNVHFSCPGLRSRLKPVPAMLYFTFNEVSVSLDSLYGRSL